METFMAFDFPRAIVSSPGSNAYTCGGGRGNPSPCPKSLVGSGGNRTLTGVFGQ